MGRLEGKVAIITGGNSGIGAKCAEMFAKEGAKVVISARREAQLNEVAAKILADGGEVMSVTCDISKADQCKALVDKTVDAFGTVDILINNAGVLDAGIEAVEKVTDETIDYLIDINTKQIYKIFVLPTYDNTMIQLTVDFINHKNIIIGNDK